MTRWEDETIPVERAPATEQAGAARSAPPPWSQEQRQRLITEWRQLQRCFAYHPVVRVLPLGGDPPDQYQIEYRLRNLVMTEAGQLEYASSCALHIWLSPAFPLEPPLIRPITRIFHPNIVPQGVNLARIWTRQNTSLVEAVSAVGAMVALQRHETDSDAVWNDTAMEWIIANPGHVPVDPDADLSPQAGGEPLARIARFAPRTMEQVRFELKRLCDALVSPEAPTASPPREIQTICARARSALAIFHADDVPEDLRNQARELDEWARDLPCATLAWEALRRHRGAAAAAFEFAQQMRDSEKSLQIALAAIDRLITVDPHPSIGECVRLLPAISILQLHARTLEQLLKSATRELDEARATYTRLQGLPRLTASVLMAQLRQQLQQLPPRQPASPGAAQSEHSALHKRIEVEVARAQQLVSDATEKLKEAFVRLDPLFGRAKLHYTALRRMADWRRYAELIERAETIVRLATQLGPEGLHAYFIENESGRFGPFELEQHVQIGSLDIAVRLAGSAMLEMIDAQTGQPLQRGGGGVLVTQVHDPASGGSFPTTFRYTGECDELAAQLSDCIYDATQLAEMLVARIRPPDGWLGRFGEALAAASSGNRLQSDHQALLARWSAICDDLRSIKRFKERLATLRLLQRVEVLATSLLAQQAEATRTLNDATQRVASIVAVSNRDEDTGRLLIPHRYAREYPEQLQRRDEAQQAIDRDQRLLAIAAADVRRRINDNSLRGVGGLPRLHILTVIPAEWESLAERSTDDELTRRLTGLESILNSPLRPLDASPVEPLEEVGTSTAAGLIASAAAANPTADANRDILDQSTGVMELHVVEELEVIDLTEADSTSSAPPQVG